MSEEIVIRRKPYELPPEGLHKAVCVDVIDLGTVTTAFGPKHKTRIVFELEKLMEDGRPFTASKSFNLTLGEKSSLEKFIATWRGKAFSAAERELFILNSVVGLAGQVLIQHTEKDGKRFANIISILKAGDNPLTPSGKYVRPVKKQTDVPAQLAASQEKF